MTKLKNPTENFKSRFNYAEKRISDLKDRTFDIIQSDRQKVMGI